jgi:acyl dehydratase
MAQDFFVTVGETAEFSKTLTENDVAQFAAISGDFDPIHVDEAHARTTPFGRRIAHGILSMALLSTVSASISRRARERGSRGTSVSMGYDRIRFLKPVFIGDTLTARYTILELDPATRRSRSKVEVVKSDGELAVVGEHLMKWLPEARETEHGTGET